MYIPIRRFVWFLLSVSYLWATHYLGGNLSYECLGPAPGNPGLTRYRVTVVIYRDCNGISIGSITVRWRSIQCGVDQSVTIPEPTFGSPGYGRDVTPVCTGQPTACPNGAAGLYGIQRWIYQTTISLPSGCGSDWIIWHDNCCRSNSIDNLDNPGGQGTVFYAFLDNTISPCNNSPQFTNLPQFFNCVNRQTLLNLGVVDPDGDSLVISLASCLNDDPPTTIPPYFTPTTYVPGRGGTNPFPTLTGFLIQSGGLFTYIPSQIYQAAFCYKVEEYRNGVKIGETFQDVYLVIQNCPTPAPPVATTTSPNRPPTVYDETNANSFIFTVPICPGSAPQQHCVTFSYRDTVSPSPQNNLRVNVVQIPPGATTTITGNNTNNPRVQLCWSPTMADIGDHPVVITVENNSCPIRVRWDYTYILRVRPGLSRNGGIAVIRGPGDTVLTRDTTVCVGTQLRLYLTVRDSVPNPSDIASISWTTTGGLSAPPSFPPPPLSGAVRPTVTVTGPGQYIATVTFRGGCVDRDTLQVRIFPPDTVRIQEPIRACAGQNVSLSASSSLGLIIRWYVVAPLTGTLIGTGNNISYPVPASSVGNVPIYAVTTDANGCVYIDTAIAIFEPGPNFTTQTTPATCRGLNNGAITATPSNPGNYTYTLLDAGGGAVAGPQASGTFSSLSPGRYIVVVQGPSPGVCSRADTVFVAQGDSVSAQFVGDSIRYACPPFSTTLEVQASSTLGGSLTYTWSFGDGTTQTTNTPSVSYTFSNSAQHIVVVRASTAQGCFATDTIIVDTRNSIGLSATPSRVCKGAITADVSLTVAANAVPPISYQAVPVNAGSGPTFGPQSSPTFSNIPVGIPYEFIAQDSRNCQGRLILTLLPTDSVEALALSNGPIENCYPVAVDFTAVAQGSGNLTYFWDFGDGNTDTTSLPVATGLYQNGGSYIVRLIVRNDAGCADTIVLPINVPATGEQITAQLTSALPQPLSGCVPLTVSLAATGTSSLGSPLNFRWEMGDGTVIQDTSVTHTYTQPGIYEAVFYAQSSPRCYDTVRVIVTVDGTPNAQIIPPPQPSSIGYFVASPITFTAAQGPYNVRYFWRADSQAAGTGQTYTISYVQKGTYCVYLSVESQLGCVDTASYCFEVSGYVLLIPNAFSPNNDGINDRFTVIGYGMESLELSIHDRWGGLIHTATGTEQVFWDGTKRGSPVPEGVYVYVLRYKPVDKKQVEVRTGTITLLR
ncbi:MAG: PKD domain-containing protein [Bacteroidia bacterium]|nr:PKD domain-containing protein [Bacteroidia bacterium]